MPNAAFTAILDDVYTLTKRPDLVADTYLAVKSATLKAHRKAFYPKDLKESAVEFVSPEFFQEISYREVFPDFRSLSYIRKYSDNKPGALLNVIAPTDIFTGTRQERVDVCYLTGSSIQIRSRDLIKYALIGYYANPNVTPDGYDSWVAQEHPYAIIYDAVASIYRIIGHLDNVPQMQFMRDEEYSLLDSINITAEGF